MKEAIIGFFVSLLLRTLNATLRWERSGLEIEGVHWGFAPPTIVAFWHAEQLMAPWIYLCGKAPEGEGPKKRRPAAVLISEHSDGRIIAQALRFLSIFNIPGSSTRGGVRALVMMKKKILDDGFHITITPDGPKGPPHKVKPGVIVLGSQTGAPILPVAFAYQSFWRANSWDGMMLPKPFSKARAVAGPPIVVPKELSEGELEEYCLRLEVELAKVKEVAEKSLFSSKTLRTTLSEQPNEGHNS